jgi:hypothetical protein
MAASPEEVAHFMLESLNREHFLHQRVIAAQIYSKFGAEFVYTNRNGNLAIAPEVLRKFRKLTESSVVWDKQQMLWRKRQTYDPEGKRRTGW